MDGIRALFIFEILGRPAEHIRITLEQLIDRFDENKGIKVTKRKVHEPHPVDKEKIKDIKAEKEIFSTFAEVEMEIDNLSLLFAVILNTLPSNVEILEPRDIRMKSFDLSSILTDLSVKLHKYDEVAKGMALEKSQLINVIKELNDKFIDLTGKPIVDFEREEVKTDEKVEEVKVEGNKEEVKVESKKEEGIEDLVGGEKEGKDGMEKDK